jgi:ankyrin repeat protein
LIALFPHTIYSVLSRYFASAAFFVAFFFFFFFFAHLLPPCSVQLVCQLFLSNVWKLQRSFILNEKEWKSFTALGSMPKLESLILLESFHSSLPKAKRLNLTGLPTATSSSGKRKGFSPISAFCLNAAPLSHLRRLSLVAGSSQDAAVAAFGQGGKPGPLVHLQCLNWETVLDTDSDTELIELAQSIVCTCPQLRVLKLPQSHSPQKDADLFESLSALAHIEHLTIRHQLHHSTSWEPMRKCKKFKYLTSQAGFVHVEARILAEDLGFVILRQKDPFLPFETSAWASLFNMYLSHDLRFSSADVMSFATICSAVNFDHFKHPFIVASLRDATKRLQLAPTRIYKPEFWPTMFAVLAASSHPDPSCASSLLATSAVHAKDTPLDANLMCPPSPLVRDYLQRVLAFWSSRRGLIETNGLIDEIEARFPALLDDAFLFRCLATGAQTDRMTKFLQAGPADAVKKALRETGIPLEYQNLSSGRPHVSPGLFQREALVQITCADLELAGLSEKVQEFFKMARFFYVDAHDGDETCLARLLADVAGSKVASSGLLSSGKILLQGGNIPTERLSLLAGTFFVEADLKLARSSLSDEVFKGVEFSQQYLDDEGLLLSALNVGMTPSRDVFFHRLSRLLKHLRIIWPRFVENNKDLEERRSIFRHAIVGGNLEAARILVELGEDPSTSSFDQDADENSLFYVTRKTGFEMVKFLVNCGVDVNPRNIPGRSPALAAAERSETTAVDWLVAHGADLDVVNKTGHTLFSLIPSLEWLALASPEQINRIPSEFFYKCVPSGEHFLIYLLKSRRADGFKKLLSLFSHLDWDLVVRDPESEQSFLQLLTAYLSDISTTVVQYIRKPPGHKYASRLLPIIAAKLTGFPRPSFQEIQAVAELASSDVDNCEHSPTGRTAFLSACCDGTQQILSYLLKKGCNPCVQDHEGSTALILLVRSARGAVREVLSEVIDALLQRNKTILDVTDKNGKTALWHAIDSNHSIAVEVLLELGARWIYEEPILHSALGKSEAMDAIFAYYEKIQPDRFQSSLFVASPNILCDALLGQDERCSKMLLRHGHPLQSDSLALAARFKNPIASLSLVEQLLQLGADATLPDKDGRLPHTYASDPEVIALLASKAGVRLDESVSLESKNTKRFWAKHGNVAKKVGARATPAPKNEGFSFTSTAPKAAGFGFNLPAAPLPNNAIAIAPAAPLQTPSPTPAVLKAPGFSFGSPQNNMLVNVASLGPMPFDFSATPPASSSSASTAADTATSASPKTIASASSSSPSSTTPTATSASTPSSSSTAAPAAFQFNFSASEVKFNEANIDPNHRFEPKYFMVKKS